MKTFNVINIYCVNNIHCVYLYFAEKNNPLHVVLISLGYILN